MRRCSDCNQPLELVRITEVREGGTVYDGGDFTCPNPGCKLHGDIIRFMVRDFEDLATLRTFSPGRIVACAI